MNSIEFLKLGISLIGYCIIAPWAGIGLSYRPWLRRPAIALVVFLTVIPLRMTTLTVCSEDWYRGHVRGYQFSLNVMLAIALLTHALISTRSRLRGLMLPMGLWSLYCLSCVPSLFYAFDTNFSFMAVVKYLQYGVVFAASYVSIRDEDDLRWLLAAMAGALMSEAAVSLWQRYINGIWRAPAWFEHTNPLAMWAYLLAIPLLGAVTARRESSILVWQWLGGVLAAALIIILALARGSIAALTVGLATTLFLGLLLRPSIRLGYLTIGLFLVGTLFLSMSFNSIKERFDASVGEGEIDLRPLLESQAAAMLKDHPYTGVGWNNYCVANSQPKGDEYSQIVEYWDHDRGHYYTDEIYLRNPMVENLYWLHLAETGWPGLIGYCIFLCASLIATSIAAWRHRHSLCGGFAGGLMIALIITYAHGKLERVMMEPPNLVMWLTLVGAAWHLSRATPASVTPLETIHPVSLAFGVKGLSGSVAKRGKRAIVIP